MNNRRKTVGVVVLTLVMTFMEMSALPAALFCSRRCRRCCHYRHLARDHD